MFRTVSIAALLTGSCFATKLEIDLAGEELVKARLASGSVKARLRQATIRKLFEDVGCAVEEQRIDKNAGNVICTLPGQTSSTIVVGGHFDFADYGKRSR
ncbi:MAG: hypothetical protein NTW28_31780 [Candidatus Solibacter sp.]|nr:hypothetical protein [Candidatus Solibacter sp.]